MCDKNRLKNAYNEQARHPLSYDREVEILSECDTCVRMLIQTSDQLRERANKAQRMQKQLQQTYEYMYDPAQ